MQAPGHVTCLRMKLKEMIMCSLYHTEAALWIHTLLQTGGQEGKSSAVHSLRPFLLMKLSLSDFLFFIFLFSADIISVSPLDCGETAGVIKKEKINVNDISLVSRSPANTST